MYVVDGDLMGRAFPRLDQVFSSIIGRPAMPTSLTDDKGNCVVIPLVKSYAWLEKFFRSIATDMGGSAGLVLPPLPVQDVCLVSTRSCLTLDVDVDVCSSASSSSKIRSVTSGELDVQCV